LTGLPNRAFFQSHLSKAITMAKSMNKRVAVMFLDLDRFKAINDSLGHQVGDQLITQAAQRISACVRSGDVIARMGGDEFTATLEGLGDPSDAAIVAQNIIDAVSKPYEINGHELFITASIGISTFPVDGEDIETLLKNADIAMYQAKYAGRDNFKFFTAESNELALENLQFESHLKKALGLDEFFLEYQPKVNLQTGKIDGVEALVRWNSSEFGRVPPDRFISILEESGLIVSVGEWILRTAVVQAKAWLDAGYPLAVSVNFSARQFWQDNLLSMIDSILNEFNLPAHLLEMEITESLIMEDVKNDKLRLIALRGMGIKISLDDFGTGYSSLSYLLRFPIDILKIDKSFIDEMANSESSTEIVKTIILLGHALKMEVIAEGVETEAQAMQLKAIGCDYIQGYWFSRPVPADDISARLLQD
jgi:diguanylate cyclase (GGDEF)-like protein